jgi:hypothetical protein
MHAPPLRVVAILLALLLAASGARAEPVPGAAAPAFRAALANWLDDDDAAALPALAGLAADGNPAARILLSLVDRMPHTHAPWLAGLTRAERRALMRDPDGQAWMVRAADVPLAGLWLALWEADTDPASAFAFADLGEARAARLVLLAHAARQGTGFAALAEDARYPDALRFLAWAEAPDDPATRAEIATRPPGDPQVARFEADAGDRDALDGWLAGAPLAEPLRAFCESACGADPPACALAAYRGLGGYRGLLVLGTPSETLIPPGTWLASAKGRRSVPRRLALLRPPRLADACLAREVALTP